MRRTCLDTIYQLARNDERVIFLGSDLGTGTLEDMRRDIPGQFFMEGVSEANVIGMAAGLAMEGYIPFVNTIATFITRRAFEQVALDLCLHNLPVRLIGNGGGLVYAPLGPTHLATDDIATMRCLPNMTVIAPADATEMRCLVRGTMDLRSPVYIRLGKGGDPAIAETDRDIIVGRAIHLRKGDKVLLVATGVMTHRALAAADILESNGISCHVLHMHTIKPLDARTLLDIACRTRLVVTIEEHSLIGGLGSAILEAMAEQMGGAMPAVCRLGIPDRFIVDYGDQDMELGNLGLQPSGLAESVRRAYVKLGGG